MKIVKIRREYVGTSGQYGVAVGMHHLYGHYFYVEKKDEFHRLFRRREIVHNELFRILWHTADVRQLFHVLELCSKVNNNVVILLQSILLT